MFIWKMILDLLTFAPDFRIKGFEYHGFILSGEACEEMFREEITAARQSRIVLTKTVLHEICKMDFCCITN